MCSIAAASLAATAIGGVMQYQGQRQAAKAQSAQYEYQAAVNRNNATIAEWQAKDSIERGRVQEQEHRQKVQQLKAKQRVGYASRGIDLGSEDVSETLADTAMLGELDALTIRSNAEREAYGYRVQASNFEASARNNDFASSNAQAAGRTAGFQTILGTASTVGNKYADFKQNGAFESTSFGNIF